MAKSCKYPGFNTTFDKVMKEETMKFGFFSNTMSFLVPKIRDVLEKAWGSALTWTIDFKKAEIEMTVRKYAGNEEDPPHKRPCLAMARIYIRKQLTWKEPKISCEIWCKRLPHIYPKWITVDNFNTNVAVDVFFKTLSETDLSHEA